MEVLPVTEKLPTTEELATVVELLIPEETPTTEKVSATHELPGTDKLPATDELSATKEVPTNEKLSVALDLPTTATVDELPTSEVLEVTPQPIFNEIRTILHTMEGEETYDVIDSSQLVKELKTDGFQCEHCGKVLATKYSLQMHTRLHTGEKPHRCNLCEACFAHPTDLRRHLQRHTGEKPYMCDVCGARFTQSGSLKGHSKLHLGEKPHKCTVCSESFVSRGLLRSHSRVHNSSKSFHCTYCQQTFEDMKLVVEHCKLFHATPIDIETSTESPVHVTDVDHLKEPPPIVDEGKLSTTFVDLSSILVKSRKKKCLCQVCGRMLSSAYALRLHMRMHNGERPYACDQCDYKCICQSDLKRHYMKHTGEKPFKCDTCDKSFAQSNTLKQHKRLHEENKQQVCKECGKHFEKRSKLIKHWSAEHRSADEPFFCSQCFETFVDGDSLHHHKNDVHAAKDQISCAQCGMVFTRLCNLRRHQTKSCQGRAHTCEECHETFCRRTGLREHMEVVHGSSSRLKCDVCERNFKDQYKLKRHKLKKHTTTEQGETVKKSTGQNHALMKTSYNCDLCLKQLSSKHSLARHLKMHEKQTTGKTTCSLCPRSVFRTKKELRTHERDAHRVVILKCYLCKQIFTDKRLLNEHKDTVHRNKCPECNSTFRTKSVLYAHITMKHKKVVRRSFTCRVCNTTFHSKSVYSNHLKVHNGSISNCSEKSNISTAADTVKNVATGYEHVRGGSTVVTNHVINGDSQPECDDQSHLSHLQNDNTNRTKESPRLLKTGAPVRSYIDTLPSKSHTKSEERPFECEDCGSAFRLKSYLNKHKRSHTKEREHVCTICGSAFKFPSHLRKHQRMHSGIKPYVCDICGKGFRTSYTLKIHRRSHTGEKPYQCMHCPYKFSCLSDLKRHSVTHDRIKRFKCSECSRGFCTKARLNLHLRLHTGDKRYSCDMCEERFFRNSGLIYHKCKVHGIGGNHLKCPICNKVLGTKHTLMKHMEKIHNKVKNREDRVIEEEDRVIKEEDRVIEEEDMRLPSMVDFGRNLDLEIQRSVSGGRSSPPQKAKPDLGHGNVLSDNIGAIELAVSLPLEEPIEITITREEAHSEGR